MFNLGEQEVVRGTIPSNEILAGIRRKSNSKRLGLKFPFENTLNGYFSKMADTSVVKSNLRQLIMTEPGERLMLPDYGCPLKSLLFLPLDDLSLIHISEPTRPY